jgi:hypothetical protein
MTAVSIANDDGENAIRGVFFVNLAAMCLKKREKPSDALKPTSRYRIAAPHVSPDIGAAESIAA